MSKQLENTTLDLYDAKNQIDKLTSANISLERLKVSNGKEIDSIQEKLKETKEKLKHKENMLYKAEKDIASFGQIKVIRLLF